MIQIPDKKYKTIRTLDELMCLIDELKNADLIAFDLETTSTKALEADIVGLSFSFADHSGYYIPVEFPEKELDIDLSLDLILEYLKPEF